MKYQIEGIAATFPVVLYRMLEEMDNIFSSNSYVPIKWRAHGRCFVVEDRFLFVQTCLPTWFNMSSFSSFQRQCNMYGFQRIGSGPDKGGYYHKNFVRGKSSLVHTIQRIKVKGTGPRKPAPIPPDFYSMPPPNQEKEPEFNAGLFGVRKLAAPLALIVPPPPPPAADPSRLFFDLSSFGGRGHENEPTTAIGGTEHEGPRPGATMVSNLPSLMVNSFTLVNGRVWDVFSGGSNGAPTSSGNDRPFLGPSRLPTSLGPSYEADMMTSTNTVSWTGIREGNDDTTSDLPEEHERSQEETTIDLILETLLPHNRHGSNHNNGCYIHHQRQGGGEEIQAVGEAELPSVLSSSANTSYSNTKFY